MDWIWIPAVALVSLFVLVLCWLFFKDYTCCPCEKKRPPSSDDSYDASPFTAIDIDPPTLPSAYRSPSSPSVVIDINSLPRGRQPPTPPPRPPRRIAPHASHLIHYKFDGNVRPSNVVRMENGIPALDLHHMRVKEAVHVTESFLKQSRGHYRKVRIITGRGLHTHDGVPRIKPAVESLLSGRNYREMAKGGCLEVSL